MGVSNQPFWSLVAILSIGALACLPENVQAANILGLFPISARSHNIAFSSLTTELAARGHHLTVITPYPISSPPPNYEHIDTSRIVLPYFQAFSNIKVITIHEIMWKIHNITEKCCTEVLEMPEMQKLIDPKKSGKKFDLILMSNFFSDCFLGLAHVYDVPVVQMSPGGSLPHTDAVIGNIALPSYVPGPFFPYTDHMDFTQRMVNFVATGALSLYFNFWQVPMQDRIVKQYFGESTPHLSELQRRISLIILNNHFTMNYPRPLVPGIIECGGMHVKKPKPLPKEFQKFMDEAKEGVVLFSMGSNLKSVNFPDEKRDDILGVFAKLKQKVLWKWEGDGPLPGKPANVRLEKWLPQSDLLAHPNMKLFVTHGGLLSLQEAVYRGVPIVGIPFYGDQDLNMQKAVQLGVGLMVPYTDLTKEKLLNAMKSVLEDKSYYDKMKELSERLNDQPQPPLQKAAFWTEYVMRHKGAKHLATASLDLYWYQLYLVDVVAVLVVVPSLFLLSLMFMIRKCCRLFKGKKSGKTKAKPKQN
ncbi:UDP-glycosyltransferase [Ladona fulva]|uniref:UDP-glucuronosyltransferase n=1 Tax=Ladona fulva TaxID=123851 RepID=A0A8K0K516_LADFU|nr:UDP-glycosyltransferase [Ladona fulva]